MGRNAFFFSLLWLVVALPGLALDPALSARAEGVVRLNCLECHGGAHPADGLSLEPAGLAARLLDAPVDKPAGFKFIDRQSPGRSYLLMKVRGETGIDGVRMPARRPPLAADEIAALEDWAYGLAGQEPPSHRAGAGAGRAFEAVRLINLPTTTLVAGHGVLFRVAHRFLPSVKTGYDSFYGLNGPASVAVGVTYGISDRFSLGLSHANLFHEFELLASWLLGRQAEDGLPVSLALHLGAGLATQQHPVFNGDHYKFSGQLSVSRQMGRLTLLLVPAYATHTDNSVTGEKGTLALGTGLRCHLFSGLALIGEWVPVLSGPKGFANGWAVGMEKKIGGHVFQFYVLNSSGIPVDQYLPGGDLRLSKGDLRLGFCIFRTF